MNRDPFETLRSRNPAPPESLPAAPMTVATRITTGHPSVRRGLAIAAAAAAVVLVGGGGWLVWSQTGGHHVVATTAPTAPTVTAAPDTTTAPAAPTLVVYFLKDGSLIPVARDLSVLNAPPPSDLGPLALDLLLWGPGAWDAGPLPDPVAAAEATLTTAIPEGTTLLGLTIAGGVATADLSAEFADASPQAIAQVVYTLTGLDGVAAAAFSIEGAPQAIGSLTSGLFTPRLESWGTATGQPSIGREFLSMYQSYLMIEHPALGGTLRAGEAVALLGRFDAAEVTLTLTAADGTLLWSARWTAAEPAYLPPEVTMGPVGPDGAWATLQATGAAGGAAGAAVEIPVWLAPLPDEPTTTTVTAATTTTPLPAGAAPWSRPSLDAATVPAVVGRVWEAAANHATCAVLFPEDAASLAPGTVPVLRERYFGGDWGLAWDLPSGPGREEPGGVYCADCGREAFGVAGTTFAGLDYTEDAIWPNRLFWPDGSHAGYGYEGLSPTGPAGEPMLAYLFVEGQGCMYNVWSYLGEEHLLALIGQLRFVDGYEASPGNEVTTTAPGSGLGELRAFPADTLTGCAPGTARHLAAFETALAGGPLSLQDLCATVGPPDWETGSGLYIPVYDLADGGRLLLGYSAPWGDGLLYARVQYPDGTERDLLGG